MNRIITTGMLLAAIALSAGCTAGKADVSGKVTHRGKTVALGTVIARGPDGIEMTGAIQPDGSYTINGVTAGTIRFAVVNRDPTVVNARARAGKGRPDGKEETKPEEPKPPPPSDSMWFALPDKYESPETSGLEASLHGGPNTHDLELP